MQFKQKVPIITILAKYHYLTLLRYAVSYWPGAARLLFNAAVTLIYFFCTLNFHDGVINFTLS